MGVAERPLGLRRAPSVLKSFCIDLTAEWSGYEVSGHPLEIGHRFQEERLEKALAGHNWGRDEPLPYLAALVCCSPFDIALHDAYGRLHGLPAYETYGGAFMNSDLADFLEPAAAGVDFALHSPRRTTCGRGRTACRHGISSSGSIRWTGLSSPATSRRTATRCCSATGFAPTG